MPPDDQLMPWCRATITSDGITLNPWNPQLIRGGPAAMALERLHDSGVALADLYAEGEPGDEELFVRYVARTGTEQSDETVLMWAQTVGYRRVWLADRVVDCERTDARVGGLAETTCRTCGLAWRDDTPEFWSTVRQAGAFPAFCLACGASLPEWRATAVKAPETSARRARQAESRR
jgi:hypothetical protein